jgi:hypothetical protein
LPDQGPAGAIRHSRRGEAAARGQDIGPSRDVRILAWLLELTPQKPATIRYEALWPEVLARHVIRRPQVNELAVKLRNAQALEFPDWEKGKRVPQPSYRTWRP